MAKKVKDKNDVSYKAWYIDQLAKSELFHKKLHEWKLIEVAEQIEIVKGEKFQDLRADGCTGRRRTAARPAAGRAGP